MSKENLIMGCLLNKELHRFLVEAPGSFLSAELK